MKRKDSNGKEIKLGQTAYVPFVSGGRAMIKKCLVVELIRKDIILIDLADMPKKINHKFSHNMIVLDEPIQDVSMYKSKKKPMYVTARGCSDYKTGKHYIQYIETEGTTMGAYHEAVNNAEQQPIGTGSPYSVSLITGRMIGYGTKRQTKIKSKFTKDVEFGVWIEVDKENG